MFGKKSAKNRKNKNNAQTFYADNINPVRNNKPACNGNDQSQPAYASSNGFYRTSTVSYPINAVNTRIPGSECSSRTASSASSYSNFVDRRRPNSAFFENTSSNMQTNEWIRNDDIKKQKNSKRSSGIFKFIKKLGRKDHNRGSSFYDIMDKNDKIVRTSTGNFNHHYIPRGEAILNKKYRSSSTLCEDDFLKLSIEGTAEQQTVFTDSVENVSVQTDNESRVSINEFITEEIQTQRSSTLSLNCPLESVPETDTTLTVKNSSHLRKSSEDARFRPKSSHIPKVVSFNQLGGPHSHPANFNCPIYKSTPHLDQMETPSLHRNRVDTPIKCAISRPAVLDGVKLRRRPKNYQAQKEKHKSLNMDDRSVQEEMFRRSFILEDLVGGKMDEEQLSRGLSRVSQVMRTAERDVCKDEVEQILMMDEDEFLNYSLQCSPSAMQVTS